MDLAALLAGVQQQNTQIDSLIPQIVQSYGEISAAGEDKANAARTVGNANVIIDSTKAAGELRAQQNARRAASSLGSNMDDVAEIMTSLGNQIKSSYVEANNALDVIHSKESVGFFDNPLEYIVNQLTLGTDYEAYNYHAQKYNVAEKTMADLTALTDSTVKAQNAIAETKTAATVQATADLAAANATAASAKIRQENMLYNVQGLESVQRLNQQQLNNLHMAQTAIVQSEHLEIAKQSLVENRKMHELALEERAQKLEERRANKEEVDQVGATINKGRAALGLPEIPVGKAMQMMKMGGDLGEQIKRQYTTGAMSDALGRPMIAETPATAARTIIASQAPLSPTMSTVKKLLTTVYSDAATGKLDKKIDPKNIEQVTTAANTKIVQMAAAMETVIKSGDENNIYKAPDLKSISGSKAIQDSVLYQKVLKPAIDAGGLLKTDPDLILALATAAHKKGDITYNDAVTGVTQLFTVATKINNEAANYIGVGLKPQVTYNAEVQLPNSMSTTVDLTNSTRVGNIISKKLAGNVLGGGRGTFGFN